MRYLGTHRNRAKQLSCKIYSICVFFLISGTILAIELDEQGVWRYIRTGNVAPEPKDHGGEFFAAFPFIFQVMEVGFEEKRGLSPLMGKGGIPRP